MNVPDLSREIPAGPEGGPEEYPAVIDYLNALFRWRRFIFKLVTVAVMMMVVYSLAMPKTFSSQAVIIPTQQETGLATVEALTGQLLGFGSGLRPTEIYLLKAILESRTLRENIVRQFKLLDVFETTSMDEAIDQLAGQVAVSLTEDNTLKMTFSHRTGWLAMGEAREAPVKAFVQEVAAAIVAEMDRLNRESQGSEARHYLQFIEERYAVILLELTAHEDSMTRFQVQHRVTLVDAQMAATFGAAAILEAEVIKQELEVAIAKAQLGADNPLAANLDAQLQAARDALQASFGGQGEEPRYLLGYDRDLPQLLKEYMQLRRKISIQSELFTFITTKHEEAKLREAQDIPTIIVLDKPQLPDRRSAPRRAFMVITTGILMSILALILALVLDFMQRALIRYPERFEALQRWPWLRGLLVARNRV